MGETLEAAVRSALRSVRDPVTGRHVRRQRPQAEVVGAEVPELRVIDDTLWERAQARLYKEVAPEVDRSVAAFRERRRPKHLLSGKVVCGTCGGTFATLWSVARKELRQLSA